MFRVSDDTKAQTAATGNPEGSLRIWRQDIFRWSEVDQQRWSRIPFYHFIDHGTNYHSAVVAPNRAEIQDRFTQGWLSWAGTPHEVILDSATEFVSKSFESFLQGLGIKVTVVPPNAHWQMGRVERHGGVLQNMLSKYETRT